MTRTSNNWKLVFEIGAIEFIEWLNENRLYVGYVGAIMNEEFKKLKGDME